MTEQPDAGGEAARTRAQQLMDSFPAPEVVEAAHALAREPTDQNLDTLEQLLVVKENHTYYKQVTPYHVALLLLSMGTPGAQRLLRVLTETEGHIYPLSVIRAVYYASQGLHPSGVPVPDPPLPPITQDMQAAAADLFRQIVLMARQDERLLGALVQATFFDNMLAERFPMFETVYRVISEASISISERLLDSYAACNRSAPLGYEVAGRSDGIGASSWAAVQCDSLPDCPAAVVRRPTAWGWSPGCD